MTDWNKEHMMGTTIMAVEYDGGVILGADSRTTTGSYIANRVSDKLTQVHDRIYCCRSGSAAHTQAVADIVRYYLRSHAMEHNEAPEVKVAATMFHQLVYNNKDSLQAGIIVAGWDRLNGGTVYSVPLGGSIHRQPIAIGGSGSTYVYGLLDNKYKPGMSREECINFVKEAVSHAMARDGSSGGVIRLAVIDEKGVERLVFQEGQFITTKDLAETVA